MTPRHIKQLRGMATCLRHVAAEELHDHHNDESETLSWISRQLDDVADMTEEANARTAASDALNARKTPPVHPRVSN